MEPDKELQRAEQRELQREGSVTGLFAGLVVLVLLAGSAVLVSYFWPVFEVATSHPTMTPPAISREEE